MTDNSVSQARARVSRVTIAVFAALVVLSTAGRDVTAKRAVSFVATDLETLPGGDASEASAVSSTGIVVGRSSIKDDTHPNSFHAFMWSDDAGMMDLGTLRGTQSWAKVIGDRVIAGFGLLFGDRTFHTFAWTPANGIVDISEEPNCPMPDGTTEDSLNSQPTAINSKGHVVGSSMCPDQTFQTFHAFFWSHAKGMIDLGTLPGASTSIANAINDDDVVVGDSGLHAFMWTRRARMADLGTLGGPTSSAQGVNDDGVIVGSSQTGEKDHCPSISHAFVYRTKMVDISPDCRPSFGEKISGRFVIGHVTTMTDPTHSTTHGFVWTQKGGFVEVGTLPDLGHTSSLLTGVNDQGLVIGNSFKDGDPKSTRAFVFSASSRKIVPLESPRQGRTEAHAISGNFIVGLNCDTGNANCHATLWTPASHSRKDRDRDDDD